MGQNRKSRTIVKYTGKSWGVKFLTKKEKNSTKIKTKKKKLSANKIRFDNLIRKLEFEPDKETVKSL